MRTTLKIGLIGLSLLAPLVGAGCGPSYDTAIVGGNTLSFVDQNYGVAGGTTPVFCNALDPRGQIEVIISDFSLCGAITKTATNAQIFHSTDETNLRLIFSSAFTKVPPTTTFQVKPTTICTENHNGAEAVALFAHNTGSAAKYDVLAEADSGTITVNYFAPPSNATGTFDLTFGGDHITGAFNANYCKNLVSGLGQ
jgi:hypothetical protein